MSARTVASGVGPAQRGPANGRWSPRTRIAFTDEPPGALVRNVNDLALTSPMQGFGKLWRKTYRLALTGTTLDPEAVAAVWKSEFPHLWPRFAHFYGSASGVVAGSSMLINISLGRFVLWSTGVVVLYDDERSFTFMTPEGHSFAGWITFGVEDEGGTPTATIDALIRTSDPLYELLMPLGGHRAEDWQWRTVLRNLAARVGAGDARPTTSRRCVDPRRQWRRWRNVYDNAAMRTTLYTLTRRGRPPRQPGAAPRSG